MCRAEPDRARVTEEQSRKIDSLIVVPASARKNVQECRNVAEVLTREDVYEYSGVQSK